MRIMFPMYRANVCQGRKAGSQHFQKHDCVAHFIQSLSGDNAPDLMRAAQRLVCCYCSPVHVSARCRYLVQVSGLVYL